jgi:hypothetical protein
MIRSGFHPSAARIGLLLASLLCGATAHSESTASGQENNPSARYISRTGAPIANAELPASVAAPEGKLTLYADFSAAEGDGVPVYLVNRTREPVKLDGQDGSLFLKLAHKDESGRWRRAQTHASATCGNSYYPVVLKPGQHFRTKGYRPAHGSPGTVRYQLLKSDCTSNEGPGLWSPADVKAAADDGLDTVAIPCLERVFSSYDGRIPANPEVIETSLAAMVLAREWGDEETYQNVASRLREDLEGKGKLDPARAKPMLARLEKIVGGEPPANGSPDRFHRACMDVIAGKSASSPANPEKLRDMAWFGLGWLRTRDRMTPDHWREIFALIRKNYPTAELMEQARMAGMIRNNPAVHEYFSTAELVTGATSGKPAFSQACMERLADRGAWHELMKIARMQKEPKYFQVMQCFCANDGSGSEFGVGIGRKGLRYVSDPEQIAFWKECLAKDLFGSAMAMHSVCEGMAPPEVDGWLRVSLSENLLRFLKEAESEPWPEEAAGKPYALQCVLELIAHPQRKPDPALKRVVALGELAPPGESAKQNAARKNAAKHAALLLRKSAAE